MGEFQDFEDRSMNTLQRRSLETIGSFRPGMMVKSEHGEGIIVGLFIGERSAKVDCMTPMGWSKGLMGAQWPQDLTIVSEESPFDDNYSPGDYVYDGLMVKKVFSQILSIKGDRWKTFTLLHPNGHVYERHTFVLRYKNQTWAKEQFEQAKKDMISVGDVVKALKGTKTFQVESVTADDYGRFIYHGSGYSLHEDKCQKAEAIFVEGISMITLDDGQLSLF